MLTSDISNKNSVGLVFGLGSGVVLDCIES